MEKKNSTKQATLLFKALKEKGIKCILEAPVGDMHIDILLPQARLGIEVDGEPHFINYKKIINDTQRQYISITKFGITIFHIPNFMIDNNFEEVVNSVEKAYQNILINQ